MAKTVTVNLRGGPADREQVVLRHPAWETWPEYMCINLKDRRKLPVHYRHVAGGFYEHVGPCAEFNHEPDRHLVRCPCCGGVVHGKSPGSDAGA